MRFISEMYIIRIELFKSHFLNPIKTFFYIYKKLNLKIPRFFYKK